MANDRKRSPSEPSSEHREDVIWSNVDWNEYVELPLAPLDPRTEANRLAMRESLIPVGVVFEGEHEPADSRYQFSLRQMLIAQGCIAFLFGLMQVFAPSFVAGALGLGGVGLAILISLYKPDDRHVDLAWWGIFTFYIIACIVALVRS